MATAPNLGDSMAPDQSCLSLVIDGADQSEFKVPRNQPSAKKWDTLWRPQLHMSACLVHGVGEYYYLADADMPKDANSNIEMITRSIEHASSALAAKNTEVPRHLFILADNTCREQKNTTCILWHGYQVAREVFDTVTQNHMGKGHSHVDVDQRFSESTTCLSRTDTLQTLSEFANRIQTHVEALRGGDLKT